MSENSTRWCDEHGHDFEPYEDDGVVRCTVCSSAAAPDDEGLTPIPTEPMLGPPTIRIFRERRGFHVYIGAWSARFSWARTGHFANGSRWFSGWHRWREDADV